MRTRNINAILFDLGRTLLYSVNEWPPILDRANLALAQSLCAQGLNLDCANLHEEFNTRMQNYHAQRDDNLFETTTDSVLRALLADKGFPNLPAELIRNGLDAFYHETQKNWIAEEDAVPTLRTLQEQGYRMGVISNAGDNQDVLELVEKAELNPYLDFVLTSAVCSYRKPHSRIFELALAHWDIQPAQAAMVGDTLEADILGANQCGIFSIFISRRAHKTNTELITPNLSVATLAEIPKALWELQAH